jgi:hypothetical protein
MKIRKIILAISFCGAIFVGGLAIYAFSNQETPYRSEEITYVEFKPTGNAEPFTDEQKNRILEEHLTTRIKEVILKIGNIEDCIVNIHVRDASVAEIILTIANNEPLSYSDTQSIAKFLKGSVPHLEYENISITDNMNTTYQLDDEF